MSWAAEVLSSFSPPRADDRPMGLLAGAAATYTIGIVHTAPLLIDPSSWLFPYALFFLSPLVVLIGTGFFLALGKQPLFADAVLEDCPPRAGSEILTSPSWSKWKIEGFVARTARTVKNPRFARRATCVT